MNENFQNIEKKGSICCFFYFTGMGTPIHGVVVGVRFFFSDDAAVATATAITKSGVMMMYGVCLLDNTVGMKDCIVVIIHAFRFRFRCVAAPSY